MLTTISNRHEAQVILANVKFDNYVFTVYENGGHPYLQATYPERCIQTGEVEIQHTRKWQLSYHMTKSELVQTAFKCALTSMEHRTRELFKYKGKRIFGPHFDVERLVELCETKCLDVRQKVTT